MKSRIVLLGPPASGKGTQAEMLAARYGIPSVSPGAVLRSLHAQGETASGIAENGIFEGKLLGDEVVCVLVREWVFEHRNQFVLDGFPRTIGQANIFGDMLESSGVDLQVVISLSADQAILEQRVANRVLCNACGASFQLGFHLPLASVECSKCNGALTRRRDDAPEVFQCRMEEFAAKTLPLIEYYQKRHLLRSVDAGRPPEVVFQEVVEILEGA